MTEGSGIEKRHKPLNRFGFFVYSIFHFVNHAYVFEEKEDGLKLSRKLKSYLSLNVSVGKVGSRRLDERGSIPGRNSFRCHGLQAGCGSTQRPPYRECFLGW
jgi:hypothetical protein